MKHFHHFKWKYLVLSITTLVILISDQITKTYIHKHFRFGESYMVIKDFFSITYVRNMGAAFGFLHSAPPQFREPFFLIVPFFVLSIILYLFLTSTDKQKGQIAGLSLILSGAIGNIIDRSRLGYVIDFLDFYIGVYHWPAFNIADSAIVVGVGLVFLFSALETRKKLNN